MQKADSWIDWGQEKKGTTEDEMVEWHPWLNGQEFEQALGDGEGQGSLACCSPWGRRESDTSEQMSNSNKLKGGERILKREKEREAQWHRRVGGLHTSPGDGRGHGDAVSDPSVATEKRRGQGSQRTCNLALNPEDRTEQSLWPRALSPSAKNPPPNLWDLGRENKSAERALVWNSLFHWFSAIISKLHHLWYLNFTTWKTGKITDLPPTSWS